MTNKDYREVVLLTSVSKTFGRGETMTVALQDVSVSAGRGELVLLLGPSGSGKTTLLTLIAGLLKPSEGTVALFGRELERYSKESLQRLRARSIGFIFQNFLLIEPLTVLENIILVLEFAEVRRSSARAEAHRLLSQLGVAHLTNKFPSQLSQGEKQRVAIARATANKASLIIADEPTASLESNQGMQIVRLLHELAARDHRCVIVASHDLRLVEFADRVLRMKDGRLIDDAPQH